MDLKVSLASSFTRVILWHSEHRATRHGKRRKISEPNPTAQKMIALYHRWVPGNS